MQFYPSLLSGPARRGNSLTGGRASRYDDAPRSDGELVDIHRYIRNLRHDAGKGGAGKCDSCSEKSRKCSCDADLAPADAVPPVAIGSHHQSSFEVVTTCYGAVTANTPSVTPSARWALSSRCPALAEARRRPL